MSYVLVSANYGFKAITKRNQFIVLALCLVGVLENSGSWAQVITGQPDFKDELSAIGASKAGGDAKAEKTMPGNASSPSSNVDFSSELRDISEKQRNSPTTGWTEDINNFKQGVASIKEQKRLNEIEALRKKCSGFWYKTDAQTCRLVEPMRTITLRSECRGPSCRAKSKCRRYKGAAFHSCEESYKKAYEKLSREKRRKAAKAYWQQARAQQNQCKKERTYCKSIEKEVQQGVLPKETYPSWNAANERAAAAAFESLDIVIAPKLDEANSLQKEQDRRQSELDVRAAEIRAAEAEKKRLIELKTEKRSADEELGCRLEMQKNDAVSCSCLKYLPDGGAGATGCGK